jgi:uncharacterized protein (TIGR03000 family)
MVMPRAGGERIIEESGSGKDGKKDGKKGGSEEQSGVGVDPTRATFVVTLPSPARLVIDDYTVASPAEQHTYITAPLSPGETRTVTFKANVMQDGKVQTLSRQVTVGAGRHAINLADAPAVASK